MTMSAAQSVFDGVAPEVGAFARMLAERNLVDLAGRDRKAGGGFCTSFPTYGLPFIFANFNGTTLDVNVLLHETGPAFQVFSSRGESVSDYLSPTLESCEIHSMSMEFLTWPYLDAFFGVDAQRYRRQHLSTSLLFLPYGAAVDEFQHRMYEQPDLTPAQRHAIWKDLEKTYLPWRTSGGIGHVELGGAWQQQRHIYLMPFYYTDYALAMCCALQFWSKSLDDQKDATASYLRLCERGGEEPFQSRAHCRLAISISIGRSARRRGPRADGSGAVGMAKVAFFCAGVFGSGFVEAMRGLVRKT
ncbi:MAG: M3 family metallopeptidase [Candidatus Eremiobacteraeota bacterium]|nr:M3 family metallopeptidase [Candidatus Eremiobacteraeota bacterium]